MATTGRKPTGVFCCLCRGNHRKYTARKNGWTSVKVGPTFRAWICGQCQATLARLDISKRLVRVAVGDASGVRWLEALVNQASHDRVT